jgi:phosphoribosylformylglycinamidine cyclo-ligase
MLNLLRLNAGAGYEVDRPLPTPPVFALIERLGSVPASEMHQVFNMGTGFVCVTPPDHEAPALELLRRHYPAAARIGRVAEGAGTVALPQAGLIGDARGFRAGFSGA